MVLRNALVMPARNGVTDLLLTRSHNSETLPSFSTFTLLPVKRYMLGMGIARSNRLPAKHRTQAEPTAAAIRPAAGGPQGMNRIGYVCVCCCTRIHIKIILRYTSIYRNDSSFFESSLRSFWKLRVCLGLINPSVLRRHGRRGKL